MIFFLFYLQKKHFKKKFIFDACSNKDRHETILIGSIASMPGCNWSNAPVSTYLDSYPYSRDVIYGRPLTNDSTYLTILLCPKVFQFEKAWRTSSFSAVSCRKGTIVKRK